MTRYLTRDGAALTAAVLGPLTLAAILLPWRGSWSNTNVALLLVVAVVAISCLGNWFAGILAAVSAALWFDFFYTVPYDRFAISHSADVTTFDSSGLPPEDVEIRTFSNGHYVGRFMLTPNPAARPSHRARLVAVALADLAGHAVGAGQ